MGWLADVRSGASPNWLSKSRVYPSEQELKDVQSN